MVPSLLFVVHSGMDQDQLTALQEQLTRIEGKLDHLDLKLGTLIQALDEEQEHPEPVRTLDGKPAGRERDSTQSLG